jgi:hypothetical protein
MSSRATIAWLALALLPQSAPPQRTSESRAVRLTVTSGGAPAAGATISFGPGAAAGAPTRDELAAFEASARHATADEAGCVDLPPPTGPTWVVARRARERAVVRLGADAAGATAIPVELAPAPELVVRVVDAQHAPVAGVEVRLLRGVPSWLRTVATATSDDGGLATFRDLDLLDARALRTDRFGVGSAIPRGDAPPLAVDVRAPPADPLELVVPPTGRLTVELRDDDDRLVDEGGTVELRPQYDAGRTRTTLGTPQTVVVRAERPLDHGRVVFAHVALGVRLEIHAKLASGRELHVRSDGPREAGGDVAAVLRVPPPGPFLIGRLLDADGAPLGDVDVEVGVFLAVSDHQYFDRTVRGRTDEEGNFRIDATGAVLGAEAFQGAKFEPVPARVFVAVRDEAGNVTGQIALQAPAAVDAVADLGELRVPRFAELARGTVVDDTGAPIDGVQVGLTTSDESPHDGDALGRALLATGASDARGEFVLRGEPPGEGFAVRVCGDRAETFVAPAPVPLPAPASGLRFVLRRRGSIEGRFLLSDDASAKDLSVRIARSDGTPMGILSPEIAFDGGFWFDRLEPASYDLDVAAGARTNSPRPLVRLAGVVVPSGAPSADPRLAEIDLRGAVRSLEVVARTRDGAPVRKAQLLRVAKPGAPQRLLGWVEEGRATCAIEEAAVDFEIRADDYRFETVRGARDRVEVVLRPAPRFRFEFAPDPLPFEITRVHSYRAEDRAHHVESIYSMQVARLDGSRRAELAFPAPGAYDVTLFARVAGSTKSLKVELPPEVARFVVPADAFAEGAAESIVVPVQLSEESIARVREGKTFEPPREGR